MHRTVVNPQLLILGSATLVGAVWLCIKNADLQHHLYSAETARSTLEMDAQAPSERADRVENAKAEAERLLAEVREALIEAHRAKDDAELTLRQAREQLTSQKEAIEATLKSGTDQAAVGARHLAATGG